MMATASAPVSGNRAEGELRARFDRVGPHTRVMRSFEAGGYRLRFPNVLPSNGPCCEAVCINTGGGMVGGDHARYAFACGPDAQVSVTTQSAEKMYRSLGPCTEVDVTLQVAAGGRLDWIPQETILFDGVRLRRKLEAEVDDTATLLVVETLVFGRLAMGETVQIGAIQDRWRLRRGGRLVLAEDLRLDGPVSNLLDRAALGGDARAIATLALVSPDAESKVSLLRDSLSDLEPDWGASAWNGVLALRAAGPSPERVRRIIVTALGVLRRQPAPRVWQC
jgi:urease accessory protein